MVNISTRKGILATTLQISIVIKCRENQVEALGNSLPLLWIHRCGM